MSTITVSFRIPADVHAALAREAKLDQRSLNFVVVEKLRSIQALITVDGEVWCRTHDCIHDNSVDPYEEGEPTCRFEDHAVLYHEEDGTAKPPRDSRKGRGKGRE